jgi:hypothetical protein
MNALRHINFVEIYQRKQRTIFELKFAKKKKTLGEPMHAANFSKKYYMKRNKISLKDRLQDLGELEFSVTKIYAVFLKI